MSYLGRLDELKRSVLLAIIVEICATRIFLTNPDRDQDLYRRQFHLYGTEAEWSAMLLPKRQFLIRTPELAKVPNLNVDRRSYWLYTNDPYCKPYTEYSNPPVLAAITENAGDPGRAPVCFSSQLRRGQEKLAPPTTFFIGLRASGRIEIANFDIKSMVI